MVRSATDLCVLADIAAWMHFCRGRGAAFNRRTSTIDGCIRAAAQAMVPEGGSGLLGYLRVLMVTRHPRWLMPVWRAPLKRTVAVLLNGILTAVGKRVGLKRSALVVDLGITPARRHQNSWTLCFMRDELLPALTNYCRLRGLRAALE
jgi:hypothetical protein